MLNSEISEVISLAKSGNYQVAKSKLLDLINNYPKNPDLHNNLAIILFHCGDLEDSLGAIKTAIYLNPITINYWNTLTLILTQAKVGAPRGLIRAISLSGVSTKLTPGVHGRTSNNLPELSTLSGKIITEVKELLRRNQFAKVTDHLVAHRFILDAEVQLVEDFVYWSLKTSSPGAAVALGRGIAEYTDLSASLFNDLAVFLQRTANKDLALELMEVAVVKSPGEYRIKNNYGSALNAIGRVAEARSIFLELVNKFPNYSPPKVNLALLYQAEGSSKKQEPFISRSSTRITKIM